MAKATLVPKAALLGAEVFSLPDPNAMPISLRRRSALFALASLLGLAFTDRAEAKGKRRSKLVRAEHSSIGTTLVLHLKKAPFPAPGGKYHDPTVLVFVPKHYRLPRSGRIDAVVHFHGHNSTAMQTIKTHQLREQLYESRQNAILVLPQGPVRAVDSSGGKLDKPRGFLSFLTDLRRTLTRKKVRRALGANAMKPGARIGKICMSAHSGGYHVAANCCRHGGYNINEVYLFDALYGDVGAFRNWVVQRKGKRGSRRHKLISYYGGGKTRMRNLELLKKLKQAGVKTAHETKEGSLTKRQLIRSEAIFIKTAVGHGAVTHRLNALRDCLYASGLKRTLKTNWFKNAGKKRTLDARKKGKHLAC